MLEKLENFRFLKTKELARTSLIFSLFAGEVSAAVKNLDLNQTQNQDPVIKRIEARLNALDLNLNLKEEDPKAAVPLPSFEEKFLKKISVEEVLENPFVFYQEIEIYSEENLKEIFGKLLEKENLILVVELFKRLKNEEVKKLVAEKVVEKNPQIVFTHLLKNFTGEPWEKEVLQKANQEALKKADPKDPSQNWTGFAFFNYPYYKDFPWAEDFFLESLELDQRKFFTYLEQFNEYKIAEKSLGKMVELTPWKILENQDLLAKNSKKLIARTSLEMKKILAENPSDENLVHAVKIANELHSYSKELRYRHLDSLGARELFRTLSLAYGNCRIAVYKRLFSLLKTKLKEKNQDLYSFAEEFDFEGIGNFLEGVNNFKKTEEFLKLLKKENKEKFFQRVLEKIGESENAQEAAALTQLLSTTKEKTLLSFFDKNLKKAYEESAQQVYGLVAKNFYEAQKKNFNFKEKDFYENLSDSFLIKTKFKLSNKELFDENNLHLQRFYFYNDSDGRASFRNFLGTFRGFKKEDFGSFVVLEKEKAGKKIKIYANKPSYDGYGESKGDGIAEIGSQIERNPDFEIHRGHSYHSSGTLNEISSEAKLIFLGSCNGTRELKEVVAKAPKSQVIATSGVGTLLVNDRLLNFLSEEVLSGKEVVWRDFWRKADKKIRDKRFKSYQRPDKNFLVNFLQKYENLNGNFFAKIDL